MPSTYFETNNRGVKSVTLNLKTGEGRDILNKLVAQADIFGQNFRPGAAEKNGFGYEELRKVNPRLVYVSVSGYGPKGPHASLPGTDSMAQALGGIAEAYSTPGQPLQTGIVSVADETCAILAFGGALAALTHARATGIGQKVDCSLLGGQIRLMGWTLTTAMWRNRDPVTGQARITGTPQRPGISASFNDRDGKPLVFQLNGAANGRTAMTALGFYEALETAGFGDLGRDRLRRTSATGCCARSTGCSRPARAMSGSRAARGRYRLGADQYAARSLERPRRAGQRLCHRGRLPETRQAAEGARLAVAFLGNPAEIGVAPELGADNDAVLAGSATRRRRSRSCGNARSSDGRL